MNISNNVSSIQAHQQMLSTSANNVANVNTDGFRPSDTRITNSSNESVIATNTQADNTNAQRSQTDLAKEIPDQIVAQNAVASNVTAIKAQDEFLGSLLDLKV